MHVVSIRRFARGACFAMLALLLVASVGCGPSTGKVTGKVTYKGEALKAGMISFTREEDGVTQTKPIIDGQYAFDKFPAGKVRVAFNLPGQNPMGGKGGSVEQKTTAKVIEKIGERPPQAPPQYSMPKVAQPGSVPNLPSKYFDPNSSGVVYEVTSGAQTKDFNLD